MTYHVVAVGKLALLTLALLSALLAALTDRASAPSGNSGQSPAAAPNTNLGHDANGNTLRLAVKTGHVSSYDESKVGHYMLPDPLMLANGKAVGDALT